MSERLAEMVNRRLARLGKSGMAKLSVASGVSVSTIAQIRRKEGRSHNPETIRLLALACGATEQEAEDMALELLRGKGAA